MAIHLNLNDLIDYTDWERRIRYDWFRQHGSEVLKISAGPHGDGRFESTGDLIRHIFSAEKRYVERLSSRPLTGTASIPNNDFEALFQFGRQSRNELKELIETYSEDWDAPKEFKIANSLVRATPKKIVIHVLMHEIRHWAQIATLFRLNDLADQPHDFLFSPIMGGEFRREPVKS
jgi:uncharacterized damage-inducible protein DinB